MYLFKDSFLTKFLSKDDPSTKDKSKDFLKFLKNIDKIKPIQNSNPAKANKKNDVEVKTNSSFIMPPTTV
jgi:hypothetical protein